jgi:hypothetical protein
MIKTATEAMSILIVGISSSGTSAIGLASITAPHNTITPDSTWIPLGFFLGGIALTITTVWKVATHKTKTDAKIELMEQKIRWLEEQQKS